MYLVMKHFSMDDVPVLLTPVAAVAQKLQDDLLAAIDNGDVFATEAEQRLIGGDIGTELTCASIVTFDADGVPVVMAKKKG